MNSEFYSNGKLLLTAEYAILDGAKGLALPTTYGQHLSIKKGKTGILNWVSLNHENNAWFSTSFSIETFNLITTTDKALSDRLIQIFIASKKLNSSFLSNTDENTNITSTLTFPRNWGLGSSSTLITNIAAWAKIDPYALLNATFGGSGYDIACAQYDTPILYQRTNTTPIVSTIDFKPSFSDQLFFVYLNQKKNSRDAIKAYRTLTIDKDQVLSKIDRITNAIVNCNQLADFTSLLTEHETLLSNILKTPTIKELHFGDFSGAIKSLGAWGGDFILATGKEQEKEYFRTKGFTTIIPYSKMIL